jgi:hypothetical protein
MRVFWTASFACCLHNLLATTALPSPPRTVLAWIEGNMTEVADFVLRGEGRGAVNAVSHTSMFRVAEVRTYRVPDLRGPQQYNLLPLGSGTAWPLHSEGCHPGPLDDEPSVCSAARSLVRSVPSRHPTAPRQCVRSCRTLRCRHSCCSQRYATHLSQADQEHPPPPATCCALTRMLVTRTPVFWSTAQQLRSTVRCGKQVWPRPWASGPIRASAWDPSRRCVRCSSHQHKRCSSPTSLPQCR